MTKGEKETAENTGRGKTEPTEDLEGTVALDRAPEPGAADSADTLVQEDAQTVATGDAAREAGDTDGGEPADAMEGFSSDVRRSVIVGGWDRAMGAALVGALAVLVVGALFVVMAKLIQPGFASGRSPLWVLARVGLAGLGALGVPIERGGDGGWILPLGALVFVGLIASSAVKRFVEGGGAITLRERIPEALKVAACFALICFVSAFVFRLRDRTPDLGADRLLALVIGGAWGVLFALIGAARAGGAGRIRDLWEPVLQSRRRLRDGLTLGTFMLMAIVIASVAVVLLTIILTVAFGSPPEIRAGEAVAFVLTVIVFLPNLAVGAAAFVLGAPISFLAATIDGNPLTDSISLIAWDGSAPAPYVYVLLLVPAVCFALATMYARRTGVSPSAEVIGTAAGTVAVVAAVAVALSRLSVSAVFLGKGNFVEVTSSPLRVFVLAAAWSAAAGWLGARLQR